MPILLQYGPIGAGAQAAQDVAAEKERQIRESERLRREQAFEEQQRYDQAMARQREQDQQNQEYRSRQQDLEQQRNESLGGYRNDQLDLSRQRVENGDTPSAKLARLEERARLRGDQNEADFLRRMKLQAQQQEFTGEQNAMREQGVQNRFENSYDQRATQHGETLDYKKARDQEHDDLMRELSGEKMKALTAAATARDEKSRQAALTAAADLDYRAAVHSTDRHFREKPRPDPITGQIDPNAMAAWSNQHRQLIEQEASARTNAERIRSAPISPAPTPGLNPQFRRDTPAAYQNDPLSEGPVIGAGGAAIGAGPSLPQGAPNDVMGEFGAPPPDPQMAAFTQFYNNLPPGSPYTAPDGSHRVKKQ